MRRALLLLTLLSSPGYATVYELDATFQYARTETLVVTGLVDDAPPRQPWAAGLNWSLDVVFSGPIRREEHFQPGTGCEFPISIDHPDCYRGSLTRESLFLEKQRSIFHQASGLYL